MNTQHLQYIIEIERTRSISQAAENLFIGQPNLSRILHDVEQMLGFRIFERSTRGVRPTTRGTIFLQHAKSILRETEAIEALGPKRAVANRLRVCIPRSAAMLDLTAQYLAGLPQAEPVDAVIRPEDIDLVKPEDGIIRGVVTHVIFKGVHYEMEVMANNYEWLVHSTDMFPVGAEVGLRVDPFDIQIMKKPESEDEEAVPIEE